MRLTVTTPTRVAVDNPDVAYVRAEDETGAFGLLPGHSGFLTALAVSVVSWRDMSGAEHHVAVRGGVLSVTVVDTVEIATRDAVTGDSLPHLKKVAFEQFRAADEADAASRTASARLHISTIRQIQRVLESSSHRRQLSSSAFGASGQTGLAEGRGHSG